MEKETLRPQAGSLRILQLCHKPPRPGRDGGCLAMDAMSSGLMALGHRVRILSACTHKHPCDAQLLDSDYVERTGFTGIPIDTRLNAVDALSSLVAGESYNIARFRTPEMLAALRTLLQRVNFDVVLIESLFMAPYLDLIREMSDALVVLRAHNVEHRIWSDLAQTTPGLTRRTYIRLLAKQLESFELGQLNAFDGILAISAEDADAFRELGCTLPIEVVPFGLDLPNHQTPHPTVFPEVFHLGAMDWEPNLRGVRWLVDEVWPLVRESVPHAVLRLAGKAFPNDFQVPEDQGVEVLGELADASTLYARPAIMAIPLLSGSGMRIKAIEGAAAALPIVSTTIGAEGLSPAPPFAIADTPREFADALIADLRCPEVAVERGQAGLAWVDAHYNNPRLVARFADFCLQQLAL